MATMIHDVTSPTHLMLDKSCYLYYDRGNVHAPIARCSAKTLGETLDAYPVVDIVVTCRPYGDEKQRAKDLAMFTRRLRNLPAYYTFTGFRQQVVDGHPQVTFAGKLQRMV